MAGRFSMAIWAVTSSGARIGKTIAGITGDAVIYVGRGVDPPPEEAKRFERLADAVNREFYEYDAHIFVMAAGIAVRMIAPHIISKTSDPAVVAVDDAGRFAVSLLSGHIGGANKLAETVAGCIGATPVVSTATDNAGAPAIDMIAARHGLEIENPAAIRIVSMAFLANKPVACHDPYHILDEVLGNWTVPADLEDNADSPGIFVGHQAEVFGGNVLVLRPKSLVVGVGCNSGTDAKELIHSVFSIFERCRLSRASIRQFATISEKLREPGMQAMAEHFGRPLKGYDRKQLAAVEGVRNPSRMVAKHMGVNSVCEAAAIRATGRGSLVVPKIKSGNVTVAVAAVPSISSVSAPAARPT